MRVAKKIKILHVVGGMNRAGTETWLMHVLRHIDRERFQMDFLVHTTEPCAYDDEIRALGSKILPCPGPQQPWQYARRFHQLLREYGPYDVVHSHVHHYSGLVLALARTAGIPRRVAHSHSNTRQVDSAAVRLRRIYLSSMRRIVKHCATTGLAASDEAATALYGPDWNTEPRFQVLHCGIDLASFEGDVDREAVRADLGIPSDAFVIGHVGRFIPAKNHTFLTRVIEEVMRREPRGHALLVGDGELRGAIERDVTNRGLADRVTFTGVRADVPELMMGAMDVFLFPSKYEGLGLVLVEAQAAGLQSFVSTAVPEEAISVPSLVHRLPTDQGPTPWVRAILTAFEAGVPTKMVNARDIRDIIEASSFNINRSIERLGQLYAL